MKVVVVSSVNGITIVRVDSCSKTPPLFMGVKVSYVGSVFIIVKLLKHGYDIYICLTELRMAWPKI